MKNLTKAYAFIKKDFLIESGYKMAFLIGLLSSVFPVFSYFFVSKLVGNGSEDYLAEYGGDYFSFTVVGLAFSSYFVLAVGTFSTTMRRSQMAGCLEAILSSQTSATSVVVMSALYSFISSAIQLVVMFSVGALLLNFDFSQVNVLATIIVFFLSLIIFVSLGIFSAAGTIIFKQGEPFGWIFGGLSSLLGGAFFPVEVMPGWLQKVSYVVPITHALDALRHTMLRNYSLAMLGNKVYLLLLIGVLLFPLSLWFFNWSVTRGKKDGTLMQY